MFIRRILGATTTFLLTGAALAGPAVAQATLQAESGMTSGRLGPTLTALVGLAGIGLGVLALRSTATRTSLAALTLGLISTVAGTVFAITADGGPGTGNGIVGAWGAIAFGLVALVLGSLAWKRTGTHG
ncbi:DUF6223 family protein [Nocardia goodfellowii]|uniref:FtsH-binding integral membrane protein n=1 Tax=Nocardia goodfellowii TaxID=882446 RepID=A0ABS4QGL1_9NOCA|nr:DUF6223 family protein [Nocardia goodfellowii]MBP2190817.1 FtsH-binding integral membrane protein [Nocardia goodfellowii]